MGIYPTENYERTSGRNPDNRYDRVIRTYNDFSGVLITEVYELVAVIADRTDCFCCSCDDDRGSDPYCRNHGWAAERPCGYHNMPGKPDEDGVMPDPVRPTKEA